MSDGIELFSPCCNNSLCIKKEYDELKVKLKLQSLKSDLDWYDSSLPVYTCIKCKKQWVIERVNK